MTAAERLAQLSGLSGVSAAAHMRKLAGAAGLAGVLLVMSSGLPSGTAAEHLLSQQTTVTRVEPVVGGSGGGLTLEEARHKQAMQEDDAIILAVAQLIADGRLG